MYQIVQRIHQHQARIPSISRLVAISSLRMRIRLSNREDKSTEFVVKSKAASNLTRAAFNTSVQSLFISFSSINGPSSFSLSRTTTVTPFLARSSASFKSSTASSNMAKPPIQVLTFNSDWYPCASTRKPRATSKAFKVRWWIPSRSARRANSSGVSRSTTLSLTRRAANGELGDLRIGDVCEEASRLVFIVEIGGESFVRTSMWACATEKSMRAWMFQTIIKYVRSCEEKT